MATARWSPAQALKEYGAILSRKWASSPPAGWSSTSSPNPVAGSPADGGINILPLFGLLLGGFAGLYAGWYLATDAVEDSSLSGLALWILLVLASTLPMWIVEGLMHLITHWSMNFGGYMVIASANLMALASAVWLASSQE